MKVAELVRFRRELFFDGAVQVGWLSRDSARAHLAAKSYVFHGPKYHALKESDVGEQGKLLQDTASFTADLIEKLAAGESQLNTNPFGLAIAGYGTGKSHLAVTLSLLLSAPSTDTAQEIVSHLSNADVEIAEKVRKLLLKVKKPFLVVSLDGMSNFELGSEFTKRVVSELKHAGADLAPIDELSPRFSLAAKFVELNFSQRKLEFQEKLDMPAAEILEKLEARDEDTYSAVDVIYQAANGSAIPVEGHDSPQDLISAVCQNYCGPQGQFAGLVIIFDEFGRFIEYAADKPHLAGDYALQQIYQGIQDNHKQSYFLGLIQYDLKAYLNRIGKHDVAKQQRFITRFDAAQRTFLSSNLETLLANLIERKDEKKLKDLILNDTAKAEYGALHKQLTQLLPGFSNYSAWQEQSSFVNQIVFGCWPLHPLTVWVLARNQDLVQNRSAISFVANEIDRHSDLDLKGKTVPTQIYPADLCLGSMREEIIAAEKLQHGIIAQNFLSVCERHAARMDEKHRRLLAGVVMAQKMRIRVEKQSQMDDLLCHLTGLPSSDVIEVTKELARNFAVLEWNEELHEYDIVSDGVPRSHFLSFLHKKTSEITQSHVYQLFQAHAKNWCDLEDETTSFGRENDISTPEWKFTTSCITPQNYSLAIKDALQRWRNAVSPDDSRGQLLYCLIGQKEDENSVLTSLRTALDAECKGSLAPVLIVGIHDGVGDIAEAFSKMNVLENKLTDNERSTYKAFIEEEKATTKQQLINALDAAKKGRLYVVPKGVPEQTDRIKKVCADIFSSVYNRPVPFPFDGYGTVRGNAQKDCLTITRAVTLKQMSSNWISAQIHQTSSRVMTVLARSWRVLSAEHEVVVTPGNERINEVFLRFDKQLEKSGKLNLWSMHETLVLPPYGMNSASAGLLLSIYLAKTFPAKGLVYRGNAITADEWIQPAFGKKSYFDHECLKKTDLIYISADLATNWKVLLDTWEQERNYASILKHAKSAEGLLSAGPVPAEHQDRLRILRNQASNIDAKIREFDETLGHYLDTVETYKRKDDLTILISVAKKVVRHLKEFEEDRDGLWPGGVLKKLKEILDYSKVECHERFASWLNEQRCQSGRQISEFRHRLSSAGELMTQLGLPSFESLAEQRYQSVNASLDKRAKFDAAPDTANQFISTALPLDTTPRKTLDDYLQQGNAVRALLAEMYVQVNEDDVQILMNQVDQRIKALKDVLNKQKQRLAEITGQDIDSLNAVNSCIAEIQKFHVLFDERPDDLQFLNELAAELGEYKSDFEFWTEAECSPEELEAQVNLRASQRLSEREEQDRESNWDVEQVYKAFLDKSLQALEEKAELWLSSAAPPEDKIDSLSREVIDRFIAKLERIPACVSQRKRDRVSELFSKLSSHKQKLDEERSHQWVKENIPGDDNLGEMDLAKAKASLTALTKPPEWLCESDLRTIENLRKKIEAHIDQLDFDSLVERIKKLKPEQIKQLIEQIQSANNRISSGR